MSTAPRLDRRWITLWGAIAAALLIVIAANAHLVYVAITSEPACVAHARLGEGAQNHGALSAAKSACSPR